MTIMVDAESTATVVPTYNPGEELVSCMDVLWEQLQATAGDGDGEAPVAPSSDELETALWQVPQLVVELLWELDALYNAVDAYRAEREAPKASGLVLPDGSSV